MTALTQKYPLNAKARKLHDQNILWFCKQHPALGKALKALGKPISVLTGTNRKNLNIDMVHSKFYQQNAHDDTQAIIKKYKASPNRIFYSASGLETYGIKHATTSSLQSFYWRALRFALHLNGPLALKHDHNQAGAMIIAGLGLGLHLKPLINAFQCRYFIIIEEHLEFILHASYLIDFQKLDNLLKKRNGGLIIFNFSDPIIAANTILNFCAQQIYLDVDGIYLHVHHRAPYLLKAAKYLQENAHLMTVNPGFHEDEMRMINHVLRNIDDAQKKATPDDIAFFSNKNLHISKDIPLIIVGSGPSLDQTMDDLKRLKTKAIIVSCGTTLFPLLKAGIKPDFHVEIENVDAAYDAIELSHAEFDLSDIVLISTMTFVPGITKFFKRVIYFMRPALCPSALFGEQNCLSNLGPNSSNAAILFATIYNFKNIYLFGLDFGSKQQKNHHASSALYNTNPDFKATISKDHTLYPITTRANFGGQCYTNNVFQMTHAFFNIAAMHFMDGKIYNCSDGIAIKGTIPKLASKVDFTTQAIDKQHFIDTIFKHETEKLDVLYDQLKDSLSSLDQLISIEINAIIAHIKAIDIDNFDPYAFMHIIWSNINQLETSSDPIKICASRMLKGTLWSCYMHFLALSLRMSNKHTTRFTKFFKDEYLLILETMQTDIHNLFHQLKTDGIAS